MRRLRRVGAVALFVALFIVVVVVEAALSVRVGLLTRRTPAPEPQHERYRQALLRRGHVVVDLDVGAFVTGPVSFAVSGAVSGAIAAGGASIVVGDTAVDAADLDVVLVGALPGPAARTGPDDEVVSGAVHAARTRVQHERHLLARALVVELEARGVPCVSPSSSLAYDNKATQLFTLARAGLPIPSTTLSDSAAGTAFISKPLSSGRAEFAGAMTPGHPRVVQEVVRGDDLRAVVVGGVCLGVGRFPVVASGSRDVDLRDRAGFQDGSQPWLWDRDDAAAALAVAAAAACHVDVAAVDLLRRSDVAGESRGLVVLEVNRTPVLADLADDLGVDVDNAVVDLLERRGRR